MNRADNKVWGISGIPQNGSKITLGNNWGWGELKFWGILGRNSPKIVEYWGWDGDKLFGEFANSNVHTFFVMHWILRDGISLYWTKHTSWE